MNNNNNIINNENKPHPTKGEITSSLRAIDDMTMAMKENYAIVNCGEGACVCTPETCTCPNAKKKTKKVSEEYKNPLH
ncbi:hypothetical protein [Oceanirhabdus sp. W0125-5]|uniref:hypothetical protein n=1 Tax=Oceanirhabdus sp. W0125-5 TaxID=2999116 RepID=UPI0022F33922|nr:hypothetical protein [Oceanirhabdus sp. W0125-5]WBW97200.1 hypothetical protein OW730_26455 [Oceanirhabdus sp. W0125-5]